MDHDRLSGVVLMVVCAAVGYWCLDRVVGAIRRDGLRVLLDRRAYLFGYGRRRPKTGLGAAVGALVPVVGLVVGWLMVFAPRTEQTLRVANLFATYGRHADYHVVADGTTWDAPSQVYAMMVVGGTYRCRVITFASMDTIERCP